MALGRSSLVTRARDNNTSARRVAARDHRQKAGRIERAENRR